MFKKILYLVLFSTALFAFNITIKPAHIHKFEKILTGYASMQPFVMQNIIAQNSGIVHNEHILNGTNVKQKEVLFTISGITTKSKMIKLQAKIIALKNRYNLLKQEYKRVSHLYFIHAAYLQEFQSIKSRYKSSKSALDALYKQLWQYQHKIFYTAQNHATVLNILKQNGTFVKAGDTVLTLSSCNKLYGTAQIFDNLNQIQPTDTLILKTLFGDKTAQVDSISMQAAKNGARQINFLFTQKTCQLIPGIIYKVSVLLKKFDVIAVLSRAVIKKNDKFYLLISKHKKIKAVQIKKGITQNGYTQIKSGITKGEKVIVNGAYFLFNKNINKTLKIQD